MSSIRTIMLALAVAGLLFIGNQARAQAPAQIFACVNNGSGTIHIVAQNTACQNGEMLLNWNVVGPQGPGDRLDPLVPLVRKDLPGPRVLPALWVRRVQPDRPMYTQPLVQIPDH